MSGSTRTVNYVVPAGVDVHTHFRDPNAVQTEGFYTGSLGAIAGGIGTVVEMPQATPVSSEGVPHQGEDQGRVARVNRRFRSLGSRHQPAD